MAQGQSTSIDIRRSRLTAHFWVHETPHFLLAVLVHHFGVFDFSYGKGFLDELVNALGITWHERTSPSILYDLPFIPISCRTGSVCDTADKAVPSSILPLNKYSIPYVTLAQWYREDRSRGSITHNLFRAHDTELNLPDLLHRRRRVLESDRHLAVPFLLCFPTQNKFPSIYIHNSILFLGLCLNSNAPKAPICGMCVSVTSSRVRVA